MAAVHRRRLAAVFAVACACLLLPATAGAQEPAAKREAWRYPTDAAWYLAPLIGDGLFPRAVTLAAGAGAVSSPAGPAAGAGAEALLWAGALVLGAEGAALLGDGDATLRSNAARLWVGSAISTEYLDRGEMRIFYQPVQDDAQGTGLILEADDRAGAGVALSSAPGQGLRYRLSYNMLWSLGAGRPVGWGGAALEYRAADDSRMAVLLETNVLMREGGLDYELESAEDALALTVIESEEREKVSAALGIGYLPWDFLMLRASAGAWYAHDRVRVWSRAHADGRRSSYTEEREYVLPEPMVRAAIYLLW